MFRSFDAAFGTHSPWVFVTIYVNNRKSLGKKVKFHDILLYLPWIPLKSLKSIRKDRQYNEKIWDFPLIST